MVCLSPLAYRIVDLPEKYSCGYHTTPPADGFFDYLDIGAGHGFCHLLYSQTLLPGLFKQKVVRVEVQAAHISENRERDEIIDRRGRRCVSR